VWTACSSKRVRFIFAHFVNAAPSRTDHLGCHTKDRPLEVIEPSRFLCFYSSDRAGFPARIFNLGEHNVFTKTQQFSPQGALIVRISSKRRGALAAASATTHSACEQHILAEHSARKRVGPRSGPVPLRRLRGTLQNGIASKGRVFCTLPLLPC
jgi:hypothetical protein